MATYGKYLKTLRHSDETRGSFHRVKPLRRGSVNGNLVNAATQLMLEHGMVDAEKAHIIWYEAKMIQLKTVFPNKDEKSGFRPIRFTDLIGSFLGLLIMWTISMICQLTAACDRAKLRRRFYAVVGNR